MKYKVNDIIRFKNSEYLVLNVIEYNEGIYLYLINNDKDFNDVSIVKANRRNNETFYKYIKKDKDFQHIVNEIIMSYKTEIKELLED